MEKRIPRRRFKEFIDSGEWKEKKLGEVSEIFIDGDWIETKDQSDSGIRLIQTGNIGINKFLDNPSKAKWISLNTFHKLNCKEVYPGDILISRLPEPAGRACIIPRMDNRMITSVDCTIVRLYQEYRNNYIIQYLEKDKYFKDILIFLAGGTRQRISRSNLSNIIIPIPSLAEQEKIGNFFQKLDRLIEVNRQKLDKLKASKSAYLTEMFPREGEDRPRRRFQGFTGEWEEKKLGEVAEKITKGTTPIDKSWIGPINYIKTESIDKDSGNLRRISSTSIKEHEGYLKRSQLKAGDILFSIVGTLGRVGVVKNKDLPANTNQQISIIRVNNIDTLFLVNYLKSPSIKQFIDSERTIGAQPSISLWQINKLNIPIPSLDEQEKIGNFFQKLDRLIEINREKLDKLKASKSAYLAEMFPREGENRPKRRFQGFTGPWEKKKLGEVVDEIGTGKSKFISGTKVKNKYAILGSTSIIGYDSEYDYIGDFLLTARVGANAGKLYRYSGKVKISDNTVFIKGGNLEYIYYYLLSYDVKRLSFGTGQPLIKASELKQINISIPSLSEQEKIGNFFKKLDDQIALQEGKIEKLEKMKKAYLAEMFV